MAKEDQIIEPFMPITAPLLEVATAAQTLAGTASQAAAAAANTASIGAATTAQTTQRQANFVQRFLRDVQQFIRQKQQWMQTWIAERREFIQTWTQRAIMFAKTMKMIAMFFPLVIVARMIIGFFQKPLEFIMLGIACLFLAVAYVIYYILSIPPFIYIVFFVWYLIFDIIPFVVYAIIMVILFAIIFVFSCLLAGINWMTNNKLSNLVLCQNSVTSWYTTPNFHMGNKFEKGLFCSRQCFPGYYPDETGFACAKIPRGQPSFCPQAEVMRLYSGRTKDLNYFYKDFPVRGNIHYLMKSPEQREHTIKRHLMQKKDFLNKCQVAMQKYDYMPLNVCSSLDVLGNSLDKNTMNRIRTVCSQAYCSSKDNYPFCAQMASTPDDDGGEFWKRVIKIIIMICVFMFIIMFTLQYMAGAVETK